MFLANRAATKRQTPSASFSQRHCFMIIPPNPTDLSKVIIAQGGNGFQTIIL